MTLDQKLALLTDEECEIALNAVLKAYIEKQKDGPQLLQEKDSLRAFLAGLQHDAGLLQQDPDQLEPRKRIRLLRAVLVQMAQDDGLSPYLTSWLEGGRRSLLDPITTALILTGLTLILSADVKVTYENKEGKKDLKVQITKKPTAAQIIAKLWGLLK